jgi:hypothetical protein
MGTVAGGDIRQFKFAGREFEVAPDCEITIKPSTRSTEYKKTGNGQLVGLQKNELASIEGLQIICRNKKADFEFFKDAAESGEPKPTNFSLADGSTWGGSLGVEGVPEYTSGNGQIAFALKGLKLEQI